MNANTKLSLASLLLLAFVSTLVGQDKVPDGAFVVEEVDGRVERFDEALGAFVPVVVGFVIERDVLVVTDSEFYSSPRHPCYLSNFERSGIGWLAGWVRMSFNHEDNGRCPPIPGGRKKSQLN